MSELKTMPTTRMPKATRTADLRDGMECESVAEALPDVFLRALREALDAGMTCEQITAFLLLVAGLHGALERMDGDELVERSVTLVAMMMEDEQRKEKGMEEQKQWAAIRDRINRRKGKR